MENTILRIEGVTKEFPGVRALDNVTLDVRQGEIHAFMGENGAGKSTMINIISGGLKPTKGTVIKGIARLLSSSRRLHRHNRLRLDYARSFLLLSIVIKNFN